MKSYSAKINYLYNSSLKIETENHVLIFDYYRDSVESGIKGASNGAIGEADLKTDKEVLVFATHSHGDHFSEVIFEWSTIKSGIKYVISSDIVLGCTKLNTYFIKPYEQANLEGVSIKAFGSTDAGVSLLVKADDLSLFHAGDLNWWDWYDESEEYNKNMEKAFKNEISNIALEKVGIAFYPVDLRLRQSYDLGPNYFIDMVKPKIFIPMHFREDYHITKQFAELNKNKEVQIYEIDSRGQEILIDKNIV